MADFRRGIKAGVATGGVYLVISAIFAAIYHNSLSIPDFIYAAGLIPLSLTALPLLSSVILLFFQYVVRGIVFGAVFAALYNFLPGAASVKKGMVLSSFFWIVAVIQLIYTTPGWPIGGMDTAYIYYYSGMLNLSSVGLALAGIISALVFGALTGFLWDRFRGKELTEERKGRPVLLVSFILGVWMWAFFAPGLGIIIRGVPAVIPEILWSYILHTSVAFLGLAGWILALVAWRKTKRGESGFKLGVAGGVIMALTGIMMLPGALAITGGVLSGRKPTIESGTAEIER
jgi:hypothetical protein